MKNKDWFGALLASLVLLFVGLTAFVEKETIFWEFVGVVFIFLSFIFSRDVR